jgi:hypothetical protein
MTFNILDATSQNSINQLFQAYTDGWSGAFSIASLYNLWYYTNTYNNNIVNCRMHYKYTSVNDGDGYYCNYMDYDTTSGLYIYIGGGNEATLTDSGLTSIELAELTMFYQTNIQCFKEDTKILTNQGYKSIQDLRKGDLVKTLRHGYKPINMIGKRNIFHIGSKERIKDQLYKCSKDNFYEIFEPLIITGCHSILVDNFTSEEQKQKVIEVNGNTYVTDNKYRLPACADPRASVYETVGTYTIYHLALENDDYYMNYGVYANGLLVETCSKRYLRELSNMTLI